MVRKLPPARSVLPPPVSTAKNSLIALLALTTVGGAVLGWYQYKELLDLRASSALTANERADLQKKIWELQKSNRELNDQLAAERGGHTENADEALAGAEKQAPGEDPRGPRNFRGRGQQFAAMRELMQKPEVQAIVNSAQKAVVDARYAALFRALNLSPDQAQKLTALLVDKQNALQDVYAAARDQGINPRTDPDGFKKLVDDAQSTINDSIKSLIGDPGMSQLTNYEQTMPQRNLVNVLQQRLSATDAPLTPSQADQLVQILASNAPAQAASGNGGGRFGGMGGDFGGGFGGRLGAVVMGGGGSVGAGAVAGPNAAPITSQAVAQAGTVLNSTQVSALQQLQQQQQNAQQLQQLIRSTWEQTNSGNAGNGGAAPATGQPGGSGASPGGRRRGGG